MNSATATDPSRHAAMLAHRHLLGAPALAIADHDMYGILRSSASRILRPTDSVRSSTSARNPAARIQSTTPRA
jgi:hypothetical protein